jgi:hypothetical protein
MGSAQSWRLWTTWEHLTNHLTPRGPRRAFSSNFPIRTSTGTNVPPFGVSANQYLCVGERPWTSCPARISAYPEAVNYVEWVERIFERLGQAAANSEGFAGGGEIYPEGVAGELGVEGQAVSDAVWQAVDDLCALGWAERPDNLSARLTQLGRRVLEVGIRKTWPEISQQWLDAEQEQFLARSVQMAERPEEHFALMDRADAADVFESLGWPDGARRGYGLTQPLEDEGFIAERLATNAYVLVRPTYLGVVRATEAEGAQGQQLVAEVLAEGETTNVEIKQRLDLDTNAGKAKFIRHALALATTRASGKRFLVIGFHDRTRQFAGTPDAKITQERFEQLLHAYADPTPATRFRRISVRGGEAVVVEFLREPGKIPYRVRKDIAGLRPGDVFVRHGSASERPTPREMADLEAEGAVARGERVGDTPTP